jgi:FixJ family two-component response regulator
VLCPFCGKGPIQLDTRVCDKCGKDLSNFWRTFKFLENKSLLRKPAHQTPSNEQKKIDTSLTVRTISLETRTSAVPLGRPDAIASGTDADSTILTGKEALSSSSRGVAGVEQATILIVDDDEIIRETLGEVLGSKGYLIETAETAKEAMEKSRTRTFNLALLDIKLPDMEGTELLKKMHTVTPKMMKVMMTSHGTLKNAMDSLNFGADAYLLKPINEKELIKTVEEKVREQYVAESMSEDEVAKWIHTRLQKLKTF